MQESGENSRIFTKILLESRVSNALTKPTKTAKVFISYAHKDKTWLELLDTHLTPLKRMSVLTTWVDTQLRVGSFWKEEIEQAMDTADVCILLLSPDFLASQFVADVELPKILKSAEEKGTFLVPIIVSHCYYEEYSEFKSMQMRPDPKTPLKALTTVKRDEVLTKLIREIKTELERRAQQASIEVVPKVESPIIQRSESKIEEPEMVLIPAGSFLMGSNDFRHEKPVHRVQISAFQMSKNVITVEQYEAYCRAKNREMPSAPDFNSNWNKKDHPIINVKWYDAKRYCAWLSEEMGKKYDLPTEAEWEYACRGGLEGKKYSWGDDFDRSKLRCSRRYAGDSGGTAPVGSYSPNGYGLYDMLGNVWEWCSDWYNGDYYKHSPEENPQGPAKGEVRALRGGSWIIGGSDDFRCTFRAWRDPSIGNTVIGFRPVLRGLP